MKNISFWVLCLLGLFNFNIAQAYESNDLILTSPEIRDVVCGAAKRNVHYTLQNTQVAALTIQAQIINYDSTSPNNLVVLTSSSCGNIIAGYGTCTLTVTIDPTQQTCASIGPTLGNINRTLSIKIGSGQETITSDIRAKFTHLGSGAQFAALGASVTNTTTHGLAQIIGDLAATTTPVISNHFFMTNGKIYGLTTGTPDPITESAQNDFATAYTTFVNTKNAVACNTHGNLVNNTRLTSGYYCLQNGTSNVTVAGTINLSGPGDFVFFVDADNTPSCGANHCNLIFTANAKFAFINTASKNNVYWITGGSSTTNGGDIVLDAGTGANASPGAAPVGTLLAGGNITTTTTATNVPALVSGRIWSQKNVNLNGNTIAVY